MHTLTSHEVEILKRVARRYQALLEASSSIMWTTNSAGEFVEPQPAWERYTGQSWQEYKGAGWVAALHPGDRNRIREQWQRALESGCESFLAKGRIWSAEDHAYRAFQVRAIPILDEHGKVEEWIGAVTDVEDTLLALAELHQREVELSRSRSELSIAREQWERLGKSNIIGICTVTTTKIVQANDYLLKLLGISRQELDASPIDWRAITPPEYRAREDLALEELHMLGESTPYRKEFIRSDGSRVPALVGAFSLTFVDFSCVTFVVDLSAQLAAEDELQRARFEAEKASANETYFLATASHDLRQPLQALTAAMAALRVGDHDPQHTQLIARADRATSNLANLLNALMQITQLESGIITKRLTTFPLQDILDNSRNEFELTAARAAVALTFEPTDAYVRSDPTLLGRMIRNLLDNAIRYTPAGGSVTVSCRMITQDSGGEPDGNHIQISVIDTGVGFDEERRAVLVEAFRRIANGSSDQYKGLGLGLSIVARLGRLLSHPVELVSEPGRGSSFTITVPMGAPEIEDGSVRPRRAILTGRVLVVDDNGDVGEALGEVLTLHGFEATLANSAKEAAHRLESTVDEFQFLISDFRLPDRNGIEVAEMARRRFPSIRPIILTGDLLDPRLEEAKEKGIRVLYKPIEFDALLEVLEKK